MHIRRDSLPKKLGKGASCTCKKFSTTLWSDDWEVEASPDRYCRISSFRSLANPFRGSPKHKDIPVVKEQTLCFYVIRVLRGSSLPRRDAWTLTPLGCLWVPAWTRTPSSCLWVLVVCLWVPVECLKGTPPRIDAWTRTLPGYLWVPMVCLWIPVMRLLVSVMCMLVAEKYSSKEWCLNSHSI